MSQQKQKKQRKLPYALGAAGLSMSYVVITQLTYCLTDSYAMSATVVGMIFMASRVFDGISDLVAGFIIDKTHTKLGKARPYDLCAIPMWLMLILCFNLPNFNTFGKILWVLLTYNLCQTVFYTFSSVAGTVRLKRTFGEDIRSTVLSICGIISAVLATVVGILCPILITMIEDQPHGWTIIVSCFAIPGMIMSLLQFFLVPEQEQPEEVPQKAQRVSIVTMLKSLFSNRYLFDVIIACLIVSIINTVGSTIGNYFYKYVYGDLSIASVVSMLSLFGYILLALMPVLTAKLGNRKTVMVGFGLVMIANLLRYAFTYNVIGLAVCAALSVLGITLATTMRDLLIIDCMKYGQWKNKNNDEAIYSSVKGFSDKVALGIGSLLAGILLDMSGYDNALDVQTAATQGNIKFIMNGIPAILAAIGIFAMVFYRLEDRLKEIESEQPSRIPEQTQG